MMMIPIRYLRKKAPSEGWQKKGANRPIISSLGGHGWNLLLTFLRPILRQDILLHIPNPPKKCHQRSINKNMASTCLHFIPKKTKARCYSPTFKLKARKVASTKTFFFGGLKLLENIPHILPQAWPEIAVPPGRRPHRRPHLASLANGGVGISQRFKNGNSKKKS